MNLKKMFGPNLTGMFKTGMILLNELIIRLMREVFISILMFGNYVFFWLILYLYLILSIFLWKVSSL